MNLRINKWIVTCIMSVAIVGNGVAQNSRTDKVQTYVMENPYPVEKIVPPTGTKVKNVILMIGDGMSLMHVYSAWTANRGKLYLENCEVTGLSKTYCANKLVTDSGAGGTAMAIGQKTNYHSVGVDVNGNPQPSLIKLAKQKGMSAGVAVTCRLWDATPADFCCHNTDRDNEDEIIADYVNCEADYVVGGGAKKFENRKDGRNIFKELEQKGYQVARSWEECKNLKSGKIFAVTDSVDTPLPAERGDRLAQSSLKGIELLNQNPNGFFMMIPQTLPEGAYVEVVFNDGVSGDRTMTADIGGTQWPQGMTVTYKLSISPSYDLEFTSEPEIQDAHYIIYPITIKAEDVPGGEWTMNVKGENDIEQSPVTLRTDLTTLTRRGFWIDEDKGEVSIKGTSTGENITVYAFLKENAGEEPRDITLELRPSNAPGASPATFTITQLCPSWNGDLGCERIEEYDEGFTGYPWGFLWDDSLTIYYDFGWLFDNFGYKTITFFYLTFFQDNPWVSQDIGILHYGVRFDFSEINAPNIALDFNLGQKNTLELYNFQGLNEASSMMQMFEEWGILPDKTLPSNPTVFAARTCALKNKFHKEISYESGEEIQRAVLHEADCVWYLPAQNEAPNMKDEDYPLSGEYWTSTAVDDNQQAYKYTVGGSTSQEIRTTNLHVRAVRQRP